MRISKHLISKRDGFLRTIAQKTQATNKDDGHLRTAAQKEPVAGGVRTTYQSIYPQTMGAI